MVFILAEMFFQEQEKGIDNLEHFFAGQSRGKQFGQFLLAAESQKGDERLAIEVVGEAKTHFTGVEIHNEYPRGVRQLLGIGQDFPVNGSGSRTVIFTKENFLPGTKQKFALFNENRK